MNKKIFLSFLTLVTPQLLHAASTTAYPFGFSIDTLTDQLSVDARLVQSCRHEIFVLGNSSEYQSETFETPLIASRDYSLDKTHLSFHLPHTQKLAVNGFFKSDKGCLTQLVLDFKDLQYSVGWAGQYHKPIQMTLTFGGFYQEGHSVFDSQQVEKEIHQKLIYFRYQSVLHSQVNIWLMADQQKLPLSPISSAIDPKTNTPYPLLQKP